MPVQPVVSHNIPELTTGVQRSILAQYSGSHHHAVFTECPPRAYCAYPSLLARFIPGTAVHFRSQVPEFAPGRGAQPANAGTYCVDRITDTPPDSADSNHQTRPCGHTAARALAVPVPEPVPISITATRLQPP